MRMPLGCVGSNPISGAPETFENSFMKNKEFFSEYFSVKTIKRVYGKYHTYIIPTLSTSGIVFDKY